MIFGDRRLGIQVKPEETRAADAIMEIGAMLMSTLALGAIVAWIPRVARRTGVYAG